MIYKNYKKSFKTHTFLLTKITTFNFDSSRPYRHIMLAMQYEKNLNELLKILICPKTGSKLLFDKEKNELISKKAKYSLMI